MAFHFEENTFYDAVSIGFLLDYLKRDRSRGPISMMKFILNSRKKNLMEENCEKIIFLFEIFVAAKTQTLCTLKNSKNNLAINIHSYLFFVCNFDAAYFFPQQKYSFAFKFQPTRFYFSSTTSCFCPQDGSPVSDVFLHATIYCPQTHTHNCGVKISTTKEK